MTDLKPCPFCGKRPMVTEDLGGFGGERWPSIEIGCNDCGIGFKENTFQFQRGGGMIDCREEVKPRIAAKWNRRA